MFKLFFEKNKVLIITALIVLTMLLIIYIIRPTIIGFLTYQKIKNTNYSVEDYGKSVQELKMKVSISEVNLTACNEFNRKILIELEKYLDKSSECLGELSALKLNFSLIKNEFEEDIKNIKEDLEKRNKDIENLKSEKEEEINKLKSEKNKEISQIKEQKDAEINNLKLQYEQLSQNTANNLCCKAKIDNPKIRFYKIENNKIICLEEGTLSISC